MWHAEDEDNIDIGIHWIYALILTLGSGLGFRVLGFTVGLSLSGLSFWDVQQLWPDAGICATHVFCSMFDKNRPLPARACRSRNDKHPHHKMPSKRWQQFTSQIPNYNGCTVVSFQAGWGKHMSKKNNQFRVWEHKQFFMYYWWYWQLLRSWPSHPILYPWTWLNLKT